MGPSGGDRGGWRGHCRFGGRRAAAAEGAMSCRRSSGGRAHPRNAPRGGAAQEATHQTAKSSQKARLRRRESELVREAGGRQARRLLGVREEAGMCSARRRGERWAAAGPLPYT